MQIINNKNCRCKRILIYDDEDFSHLNIKMKLLNFDDQLQIINAYYYDEFFEILLKTVKESPKCCQDC